MNQPPRVLHLVISLACGGLETLVVGWTNRRNRQWPGSTVISCLDSVGELGAQVEGGMVTAVGARRDRFPWDIIAVRELRSSLRDRAVDIVHSHNLAAWQYGAIATWGMNIRQVHTEHGTNLFTGGVANRARLRVLAGRAERVVAVSDSTAESLRGALPGACRLDVVRNGVDCRPEGSPGTRNKVRARFGVADDVVLLGSVGRLTDVKGYDRLLPVVHALNEGGANARLLLVGDGDARLALRAEARRLGMDEALILPGYDPEARKLLCAMDLFVLPSRSEGLSVALLEAMAEGCPVAVTDAGDSREVIGDGEAGVLLPDEESRWPAVIAELVTGPGRERCRALAETARQRVASLYSVEGALAAYEDIYAEVMGADREADGGDQ